MSSDGAKSQSADGPSSPPIAVFPARGWAPGTIVAGKFRVDAVLGQGGMGIVYRAFHLDLEQPLAIKLLREDLVWDEITVERMLREARTAAKLHCEHVARVLDVGRMASGAPYLVMEYLEGEDLGAVLESRGALEPTIAIDAILQSCEAVAEAHAHGIIHRDLKPENLFVTTSAHEEIFVKVLDFGISKDLSCSSSLTQPKMVMGSPAYMSPEQMRADGSADARADIWSLGAVLYELVTGFAPFDGSSLPAICHRVCHEEPVAPSARRVGLAPGLDQVIRRAMAKRLEDRYASVADFAEALAPFGDERAAERAERVRRILERKPFERGDARRRSRSGSTPVGARRESEASLTPSRPEAETLASTPGSVVPVVSVPVSARRWSRARSIAAVALAAGAVLLGSRATVSGSRAQGFEHGELTLALPVAAGRADAPRALPVSAVPPVSAQQTVTRPEPEPSVTARAPVEAPRTATRTARGGSPKATPASRGKASATATTAAPSIDAWDPSAFGGRK